MNLIFIKKSELFETDSASSRYRARLSGARARQAMEQHDLGEGLEISCVLEDTGRGKVKVEKISVEEIDLNLAIQAPPYQLLPIDLVVAFSRPQTMKKILQLAASFGIRSLSFIKTEGVVPGYLQSKALRPDQIEENFIIGCQQSGECCFPLFNKFFSLKSFLNSELVLRSKACYFGDSLPQVTGSIVKEAAVLLLGPESGLTEAEKGLLRESEFKTLSLGPRMLRVEVAAAALLGKLL